MDEIEEITTSAKGGGKADASADDDRVGWVGSVRLSSVLEHTFPTAWWSLAMDQETAEGCFDRHCSLRGSYSQDPFTRKWTWCIKPKGALPLRDASKETLDLRDRSTPAFYETTLGELWISHSVWDAFSLHFHLMHKGATRHWSVQEARVNQLHLKWKDGNRIVDEILTAPSLFPNVEPYTFSKRTGQIPS